MNIFRKLAWTAVVATTVPASTVGPLRVAATEGVPSGPAAAPAAQPRPVASAPKAPAQAVPVADWPGWPWPSSEADEIEDEFEGEGWSFWGR